MARFLSFRQLLVMAALLYGSHSAVAYDFDVDGFYYNKLSENTVEVTYKEGNNGDFFGYEDKNAIAIPSTVDYDGVSYSVTAIGNYAFSGCSGLTSVSIPDGVTAIKGGAFYECSGLTSIDIPDAVTSIERGAFAKCKNLTSINIGEGNANFKSDKGIVYSKDMTTLITYPSVSGSFTIPDGITAIGEYAFAECSDLTSVNIPDRVTSIGRAAFYGCSGLTSIVIPDGITSIGNNFFSGCSNLASVTLPDCVTTIGENAFVRCNSLTSIDIPDGVTSIGGFAFAWCSGLKSVNIPAGVTSIRHYTFFGCSSMASIICLGDTPPTCGPHALDSIPRSECTIYVPEASLSLYQSTSPWSEFTNIQSTTTGIDNVEVGEDKPAVIYDLNGRRLSKPKRGLNIINGKKIIK